MPNNKPTQEPEIVNITCRATPECTGDRAKKEVIPRPGGGVTLVRFICETCKRPFTIPMGTAVDF